ncbi:hypothetical protein QJQ45_020797 [Haematococcus lacustris]|nr:hypothetical protein QJQ45_020797 [Haematococcus lacustris]
MEIADEVMELEQVFRKRMDYGHHVALYLAAQLNPRYHHKSHNLTNDEVWAAKELAVKLTSADGEGKDAAGNADPEHMARARRVLSIPATSAAIESIISAYKFIWSGRRSRLLLGRM